MGGTPGRPTLHIPSEGVWGGLYSKMTGGNSPSEPLLTRLQCVTQLMAVLVPVLSAKGLRVVSIIILLDDPGWVRVSMRS